MEPTGPHSEAVSGHAARLWREMIPLYALAAALVCAASAWYLLKELAPLLRPLVLAIFLVYTVMPVHMRLRQRVSGMFSVVLLAVLAVAVVLGLAVMIYGNVVELNDRLPHLIDRARAILVQARNWAGRHLPPWVLETTTSTARTEAESAARLKSLAASLVNSAAGFLAEAVIVGFYVIFLLLEVRRFPARVKAGFATDQADRVLGVVGSINGAMTSYLEAKAFTSLITALPVAAVLWSFGVPFAAMWGVLAFVGNFIPYVGSLVAFILPIALAFLELEPVWRPLAVLVLLVLVQLVTNNFIEPMMTARAVDLSPLVVLISLAFWGLCWGVIGMVLAVPLTVMLKIVAENFAITRPLARLMAGS